MARARSVLRTPRGSEFNSLIAKRYLILEAESVDFWLTKVIPPSLKAGDEAYHPPLFVLLLFAIIATATAVRASGASAAAGGFYFFASSDHTYNYGRNYCNKQKRYQNRCKIL